MAASAGVGALAGDAAFAQATRPSAGQSAEEPIGQLISAVDRGLSSALGAMVAAATPQSALPPKAISAHDRASADPPGLPTASAPVPHHGGPGSIPPASAGTNGSFRLPSAAALERARPGSVAQVVHIPPNHVAVMLGTSAVAPSSAPPAVKNAIDAANTLVGQPYVWGGGHASFYSHGYDCSGSVSFALAGGGFLQAPLASGQLANWGAPGPGKWITVYANGSHTYAVIAGLRWDTVGDARGSGPRWHPLDAYPQGFTARHLPGL